MLFSRSIGAVVSQGDDNLRDARPGSRNSSCDVRRKAMRAARLGLHAAPQDRRSPWRETGSLVRLLPGYGRHRATANVHDVTRPLEGGLDIPEAPPGQEGINNILHKFKQIWESVGGGEGRSSP